MGLSITTRLYVPVNLGAERTELPILEQIHITSLSFDLEISCSNLGDVRCDSILLSPHSLIVNYCLSRRHPRYLYSNLLT